MTLRAWLVLAAAYLLAVAIVALEVPLAVNVERRTVSEFRSNVLSAAALVASRISDDIAAATTAGGRPRFERDLQSLVKGFATAVQVRILVTNRSGRVLADSAGEARLGTLYRTRQRPEFAAALGNRIDFRQRYSQTLGQDLLLVTVPVHRGGGVIGTVRVSESLEDVRATVRRSRIGLILVGAAVMAGGLALAWLLATLLARRVGRLEEAAGRLGEGDLQARAPEQAPREISTLARSFNRTAATLSSNLTAQRDFLGNASHQLRTPLTGLKLRLEAIEQEGGFAADQARKAAVEADRLAELVDDLLILARAASVEATAASVDLSGLAREAVDRWAEPAGRAGKTLLLEADSPCNVWADARDVGQVLDNLIDNSIRYTPEGTQITVAARWRDGSGLLEVIDTGPGIPAEDRPRVFERFYRGSNGRQAGPGTGLGLSIAAELVRRWRGRVHLADGDGTRVEVTFPRPTVS